LAGKSSTISSLFDLSYQFTMEVDGRRSVAGRGCTLLRDDQPNLVALAVAGHVLFMAGKCPRDLWKFAVRIFISVSGLDSLPVLGLGRNAFVPRDVGCNA
jgi:hypothetical protein